MLLMLVAVASGQIGPGAGQPGAAPSTAPAIDDLALVPEKMEILHEATPGQVEHTFTFRLRNASAAPVVVDDVKTSCGCTVARMPERPWVIPPGESRELPLVFDLRGRSGEVVKTATVETRRGRRILTMRTRIPATAAAAFPASSAPDQQMRDFNLSVAKANRQAVFGGDCARCHFLPAVGQTGATLYQAACGICHDASHRASFVPGLRELQRPADRDYWRTVVVAGKHGTLMPGFSTDMGGPLTRPQIDSLVEYLVATYAVKK